MKIKNSKKGFSLVEMMVSVALFSAVMLIGVGALLSLIDANRKTQALNSVINNLNFALESMSRNLRVGMYYNCGSADGGDCSVSGDTSIYFTSSKGEDMAYRYNSERIEVSENGGASFTPITAEEVKIEKLRFYVSGTDLPPSDKNQPKVLIIIQGKAGVKKKIETSFNLQTMVSQRVLDL